MRAPWRTKHSKGGSGLGSSLPRRNQRAKAQATNTTLQGPVCLQLLTAGPRFSMRVHAFNAGQSTLWTRCDARKSKSRAVCNKICQAHAWRASADCRDTIGPVIYSRHSSWFTFRTCRAAAARELASSLRSTRNFLLDGQNAQHRARWIVALSHHLGRSRLHPAARKVRCGFFWFMDGCRGDSRRRETVQATVRVAQSILVEFCIH